MHQQETIFPYIPELFLTMRFYRLGLLLAGALGCLAMPAKACTCENTSHLISGCGLINRNVIYIFSAMEHNYVYLKSAVDTSSTDSFLLNMSKSLTRRVASSNCCIAVLTLT